MEASTGRGAKVRRILGRREIILLLAIVIGGLIVGIIEPVFLSRANIFSILVAITVTGFVAMGMDLVLACGELDLAVGMTMAFTGVIMALLIKNGVPVILAIILGLVISALIGVINGVLVAGVGLNSFITTLGMSSALEGLMLVFASGVSVTVVSESFKNIGQGRLFGIQYPVYILFIVALVMDYLFRNSKGLRQMLYVGSNKKAAKLSGINARNVTIGAFIASGLLAGVAGMLMTARFGSASLTVGSTSAMDAITACVLGGSSLTGGKGSIWGCILGALLLAELSTVLNLLGVNIYWQNFITGIILILAILLDAIGTRRRAKGVAVM